MAKFSSKTVYSRPIPYVSCYVLLLVSFVLPQVPAWAHQVDFDFYSIREGLSSPVVTDIVRDHRGFLWMGTLDGLNRFDGYQFRSFNQGPHGEYHLSRGYIDHLGIDQDRKLVIHYRNNPGIIDLFDPITFEVENIRLLNRSDASGHPRVVTTDRFGRIFIVYGSSEGLDIYEYTPQRLEHVFRARGKLSSVSSQVQLLVLENSQFVLYDEMHGLRHYSALGRLLFHYKPREEGPSSIYPGRFTRLTVLEEGQAGLVYLSFFNNPGLYLYNSQQRTTPRRLNQPTATDFYMWSWKDENDQVLLASRELNATSDLIDHLYLIKDSSTIESYDDLLKAHRRLFTVYSEDFGQSAYIGSFSGMSVFTKRSNKIETYLADDDDGETFGVFMRGIVEDDSGDVYALTEDDGLYRIDAEHRFMDSIPVYDNNGEEILLRDATQLVLNQDGQLYLVARPHGRHESPQLIRVNPQTCQAEILFSDYRIATACLAEGGSLYLGTQVVDGHSQLLRYDPGSQQMVEQTDNTGQPITATADMVHVAMDPGSKLLRIGTITDGLLLFHTEKRTLIHEGPDLQASINRRQLNLLNDYTVYDTHQESDRYLLVATRGGLHRYDMQEKRVVKFWGQYDGLSSNVISAIIPTGKGTYWLTTYHGVCYFDEDGDPDFLRFYHSDGITNNEFNRYAELRDRQGRNYLGTINGLNVFYDEELLAGSTASPVVVSRIACFGSRGERLLETGLDSLRRLVVKPHEKSIAIQFAMPTSSRSDRNRFRVLLDGQDKDWVALGSDRTARYSNLSGGFYTLLVQGADANGDFGTQSIALPILVRQHVWEKSWFLIVIGLLLAGLVVGLFYYQLRDRLRSERLRTQISSDIHDEVSGLLAGITLQTELLQADTQDRHLKNRLRGVGEAGRKAMSKLSDVIWSIDSRRDTIGELFQRMQEHADDVLMPINIKYRFYFDPAFDRNKPILGDKRQDIYFIYKEAINNIARHSNGNQVKVVMTLTGKTYELLVEDNGNSIPTNGLHDKRNLRSGGQGLLNLRMRAQRLNATLSIETEGGYRIRLRGKKI